MPTHHKFHDCNGRMLGHLLLALTLILGISGCEAKPAKPPSNPAALSTMNYSPVSIDGLTVSIPGYGSMRSSDSVSVAGLDAETGYEHGPYSSECCINLPERWHQGLTANLLWLRDADPFAQNGLTEPQQWLRAQVRIPPYQGAGGALVVQFLPGDRVKVRVQDSTTKQDSWRQPKDDDPYIVQAVPDKEGNAQLAEKYRGKQWLLTVNYTSDPIAFNFRKSAPLPADDGEMHVGPTDYRSIGGVEPLKPGQPYEKESSRGAEIYIRQPWVKGLAVTMEWYLYSPSERARYQTTVPIPPYPELGGRIFVFFLPDHRVAIRVTDDQSDIQQILAHPPKSDDPYVVQGKMNQLLKLKDSPSADQQG